MTQTKTTTTMTTMSTTMTKTTKNMMIVVLTVISDAETDGSGGVRKSASHGVDFRSDSRQTIQFQLNKKRRHSYSYKFIVHQILFISNL